MRPSWQDSTTVRGLGCASTTSGTFASHLIVDLRLDVAQVSHILGHARVGTTLNIYTHLFDEVRHSREVRSLLAGSAFAELLGADGDEDVISLPSPHPAGARRPSARERAAARWGIRTEAHRTRDRR
jgi:hypothetical protein